MGKRLLFWTKIVVIALALLLASGCGVRNREYLPILDAPFSCRVEGMCGDETFGAAMTVGEWQGEGERRTRSCRICYTSPDSLAGMTAVYESGECRLYLEEMEITDSSLTGFLVPAKLLADPFTVAEVKTEKKDGKAVSWIFGNCENGSRVVRVDSATGRILSASGTLFGVYAEFDVSFAK